MNNFFAGKVIFARKCQIFDPVVRLLSRLQLFSRLQLSRTTLTFRNDFNFPERLSLVFMDNRLWWNVNSQIVFVFTHKTISKAVL